MASKKENKNQARISGIVGADPPAVERTPDRDFRVGDRILYRRAGSLTEMSFRGVVDGLVVRLNANKQLVTLRPDQCAMVRFPTRDEVVYRRQAQLIRFPEGMEAPNAKVAGPVLRLESGGDLTIMPMHCHYEGLSVDHASAD